MSCFPCILLVVSWLLKISPTSKGHSCREESKQINKQIISVWLLWLRIPILCLKSKIFLKEMSFFNSSLYNKYSLDTASFHLFRLSLWPGPQRQKDFVLGFQHVDILTAWSLNLCFIIKVFWDSRAYMWRYAQWTCRPLLVIPFIDTI